MILKSIQIDQELRLTPFASDNAAEACRDPDARIWLDLQAFEPAELEEWLDALDLTGLPRRLSLESRDRPGFYPLKKEIFLVVPVLADAEGPAEALFLAFVCRENLLLTMHRRPMPQLGDIEDSEYWLSERNIAELVSGILVDVSVATLRRAEDLRAAVHSLEEAMDREPDAVEAEEILRARAQVLDLTSVAGGQLLALRALTTTDRSTFQREGARVYMQCALVNLQAANGVLASLDGRVRALRVGFQMHAQEQTNRRLNMLTILSAIFMPVTLLAGIWGMNFEVMPELKHPYAYPVALVLMVTVGAGMYLFFRRRGWFD
jgi:magnesium transporter